MLKEKIGIDIERRSARKRFHRLEIGKALEPEFATETRIALTVVFYVLQAVPDRPEVSIAHIVRGYAFIESHADRSTRGVRSVSVEFTYLFFQSFPEEFCFARRIFLVKHKHGDVRFYFVITAPQSKRRMIAQAFDVIFRLAQSVFHEFFVVQRIRSASEHEILPNEYPALVAHRVKLVALVKASAPHPYHVESGTHCGVEKIFKSCLVHPVGHRIGGYPVGAFGKDRNAVHEETEVPSEFVLGAIEFYRP